MSCQPDRVKYSWAVSLHLDRTSAPPLFVGCRSTFLCDRASVIPSTKTNQITTWRLDPGKGNPAHPGDYILYNQPIKIAQVRGGSDCGSGNYLSMVFTVAGSTTTCQPTPAATFRQPKDTQFNDILIVPIGQVDQEVRFNTPFNLAIVGPPPLQNKPWYYGPPDSDGDLTVTDQQSRALKLQFWQGDTYTPDPVTCQGECYEKGKTCHDLNPELCSDSSQPNNCSRTTIKAGCTRDANGNLTYDCQAAAPCYAPGNSCYQLNPKLCPESTKPNLCSDGKTQAVCSIDSSGKVSYTCPKVKINTLLLAGIIIGAVVLLVIIGIVIGEISRRRKK